jgi:hypothetical protein
VVGELADLEAGEALAAEDDPGQGRGERLDGFDPADAQGAVGAAVLGRRGGDGESSGRGD